MPVKEVADVEFALGIFPPRSVSCRRPEPGIPQSWVYAAQAIEEKGARVRSPLDPSGRRLGRHTIADTGHGVPESFREKIFEHILHD